MGRVAVILILLFSFASARWCIRHAAQKKIFSKEDVWFYQNFPKGVIGHQRGWYLFLSGPYSYEEARVLVRKARTHHPDAYLFRCKSLKAKNVKKIFLRVFE